MKLKDIASTENRATVVIPDSKTHQSRVFIISNLEWIKILQMYLTLKKNIENDRFFMQMRYGKIIKQPFGHNSISKFPNKIAIYLKLDNPETYTDHCFRL